MTQQEVEEFLFVNDFELIFDEPRNLLKFRKGRVVEETYLHELPRRVTELLWLAFTHVGLFLSHPEMAERFDSPKSTAPSRSNLIHVSRCRLAKVLPANLCNRIFGKGRNHGYMIRVYGWSFCWIRLQQSRESSCLIYR
jgi:DNA-binding response OmpR family regulator